MIDFVKQPYKPSDFTFDEVWKAQPSSRNPELTNQEYFDTVVRSLNVSSKERNNLIKEIRDEMNLARNSYADSLVEEKERLKSLFISDVEKELDRNGYSESTIKRIHKAVEQLTKPRSGWHYTEFPKIYGKYIVVSDLVFDLRKQSNLGIKL